MATAEVHNHVQKFRFSGVECISVITIFIILIDLIDSEIFNEQIFNVSAVLNFINLLKNLQRFRVKKNQGFLCYIVFILACQYSLLTSKELVSHFHFLFDAPRTLIWLPRSPLICSARVYIN